MPPMTLHDPTIGSELARIRLAHRGARLEALVSILRFRSGEYTSTARSVPDALRAVIADYEDEASAIRDRLA